MTDEYNDINSIDELRKVMNYSSDVVDECFGPEKHRRDASMYLHSIDRYGIENQFMEIIDNATDECCIKYGKDKEIVESTYNKLRSKEDLTPIEEETLDKIRKLGPDLKLPPLTCNIIINNDDSVICEDPGRGFPCSLKERENLDGKKFMEPACFALIESDSAGTKGLHSTFNDDNTGGVSGTHGAGLAVSCSCSSTMDIDIKSFDTQRHYEIKYVKGKRQRQYGENGLLDIGGLNPHPNELLAMCGLNESGTRITYKYDPEVFTLTEDGRNYDEAFDIGRLTERLQYSLMGLEEQDAVNVSLKYHDNPPILLTPKDVTPEKILKVENFDNLLVIPIISSKTPKTDGYFKGKIYIYYDPDEFYYKNTVIVNRLVQEISNLGDMVQSNLRSIIESKVKNIYKYKNKNVLSDCTKNFRVCIVLYKLTGARFAGQVKNNLTSTDHAVEFERLLTESLMENANFFNPVAEYLANKLKAIEKSDKEYQELLKKREEAKKEEEEEKELQSYIEEVRSNPTKYSEFIRKVNAKSTEYRIMIKATSQPKEKTTLVICEGNSFVALCPKNLVNDPKNPVEIITLTGKTTNIYTNKNKKSIKLEILDILIFGFNYKRVIILTDADGDGAHIAMLTIASIYKRRPDWIENGKVFVARSPLALIDVKKPLEVTVYNKVLSFKPKQKNIVMTEIELDAVLREGATIRQKYTGLASSLSDPELNLELTEILSNPNYLQQLKKLTPKHIEILEETMKSGGDIKKVYTRENLYSFTQLMTVTQKSFINSTKINFNNPNLVVTDTPNYKNHQILCAGQGRDINKMVKAGLVTVDED